MYSVDNGSLAAKGKKDADVRIFILFSVIELTLMRSVYNIIGELSYIYADAVFGLDGISRELAVSLALSVAVTVISGLAVLIVHRGFSVKTGVFVLLSVLGLTYCGKIGKVLEYLINAKPKSSQDVRHIHDRITLLALILSAVLAMIAGAVISKLVNNTCTRKTALVPVCVFGTVTVVLNAFYIYANLSASLSADTGHAVMFGVSIALDILKLTFLSVFLLSKRAFNSEKLFTAIGWLLLFISLFVCFYDLGFVPFDFLGRIDGNFFQG